MYSTERESKRYYLSTGQAAVKVEATPQLRPNKEWVERVLS